MPTLMWVQYWDLLEHEWWMSRKHTLCALALIFMDTSGHISSARLFHRVGPSRPDVWELPRNRQIEPNWCRLRWRHTHNGWRGNHHGLRHSAAVGTRRLLSQRWRRPARMRQQEAQQQPYARRLTLCMLISTFSTFSAVYGIDVSIYAEAWLVHVCSIAMSWFHG